MSVWGPWAFFTPLILWLCKKFPISPDNWQKAIPIHMIAGCLLTAAQALLTHAYVMLRFFDFTWESSTIFGYFIRALGVKILIYWVIVGLYHLHDFYKRNKDNEIRKSKIESQLAQAQLKALKAQLHPHFLFNTLHTIGSMVYCDADQANRMITQLSDLLRIVLKKDSSNRVLLTEEMEFCNLYLKIQKTRFKDNLEVIVKHDNNTQNILVPSFILQPFVENAVIHGFSKNLHKGLIKVVARNVDQRLLLEVHDNGEGIEKFNTSEIKLGLGITNSYERLKRIYNEDFELTFSDSDEGGLRVTINIPFLTN